MKQKMTPEQQAELITPWVNPEERVTVDFDDVQNLNGEVFGGTEKAVHSKLQQAFPHMKEGVTISLRDVLVEEDPYHYIRTPDTPIHSRLCVRVGSNRLD